MDASPVSRHCDARNEGPAAVEFALVDGVVAARNDGESRLVD